MSLLSSRRLTGRLLAVFVIGFTASTALISPALAVEPTEGHVNGVVRDEFGKVVSQARVRLLDHSSEQPVVADTTGSGGRYDFAAPAGVYDLAVTGGSSEAPYTAVIRDITVPPAAATFDVVVVRPDVTLTGRIVDDEGLPLPYETQVMLEGGRTGWRAPEVTTSNGFFALQAPRGIYGLTLRSRMNGGRASVEAFTANFDLTEDRSETFRLPVTDIDVTVETDTGEVPTDFITISCQDCKIDGDLFPGADARFGMGSDASPGATGTTRLRGLAATNARVYVPGTETLFEVNKTGIDLSAPGGVTVRQRALPTGRVRFQGQVTDNHGAPIDGYLTLINGPYQAEMELYNGQGFDLSVPPGTYQLKLRLNVETVEVQYAREGWAYTEGLFVTLDDFELTADRTQNITLPALVDFPVHVVDADGNPSEASVNGTSGAIAGGFEEGDALVELFPGAVGRGMLQNSDIATDATGTAHLKIFAGAAPPTVIATIGDNTGQVQPARTATEATVRLRPELRVGGTIRDVSGPLAEPVRIDVGSGNWEITGGPWEFSMPAGTHYVGIGYPHYDDEDDDDVERVAGPTRPAYWWMSAELELSGDRELDFTLPATDTADIRLYNEAGRPGLQGAATTADSRNAFTIAPGIQARGHARSAVANEQGHINAPMFGPSNVIVWRGAKAYGPWIATFPLDPNRTVHVAIAVNGTGPASDGTPGTDQAITTPAPSDPGVNPGATAADTAPARSGYWALSSDGKVFNFGDAPALGHADAGAVDLEPTLTGKGYWTLNRNGAVQAFGDAAKLGDVDLRQVPDGEIPASLSATPSGKGYWVFTNRGRTIAFGDAPFLGDMNATKLNGPILGSVATPTGKGYYMVASDGGIFAFGDAAFAGSMGDKKLNAPVQSLVPDSDGAGYWLVASDGGIFAFDAPFRGSMGDKKLNKPVVGMVRYGNGYLMVGADGGIFNFSNLPFSGSLGDKPPVSPVVAVAALP